jgi:hypothetical protein
MTTAKKRMGPVQFVARTICFDVHGDEVLASTQDFEVLEVDATPFPAAELRIKSVSGGLSKEDAIASLRAIIVAITEQGLPQTVRQIPRDYAQACLSLQRAVEEVFAALQGLPENWRTALLPTLQHAMAPDAEARVAALALQLSHTDILNKMLMEIDQKDRRVVEELARKAAKQGRPRKQ